MDKLVSKYKEDALMEFERAEKLEKENEQLKEYISQLEHEKDSMVKSLYKILRIANTELND